MKTYINKTWTARNYECTNVIVQITDAAPRNFNGSEDVAGNWVEVDAQEVADIAELTGMNLAEYRGFDKIGGFGNYSFYGYL
jgi:hypothetical protein